MDRIKYDFAFPLGAACASSLAMRFTNLQHASFPFDWVGGGTVVGRARIIADDFRDWFRMEDLELTDVLHAIYNASIYRNRRTSLSFVHDFPAGCYLEDEYAKVAEKFDRRIKRLYEEIGKARRVLVVYNEIPYRPVADEKDVLEAQRLLQGRFPGVRIDLLYFAQDSACKDREPRILNDNVTMVLMDYHSIDRGYVSVAAQYQKIMEYLRDRFELSDVQTPAHGETIQTITEKKEMQRWGAGFRRWVNRRAYRLYRHLERFLVKRGCVPDMERPIKMYEERGERRRSLVEPDISSLPRDEAASRQAYALL